jgi:hypothetical protein
MYELILGSIIGLELGLVLTSKIAVIAVNTAAALAFTIICSLHRVATWNRRRRIWKRGY